MDVSIMSVVIGAVSAFLGAVIGGIIAAWATNKATTKANQHSSRLQREKQEAAVCGFLQGIRTEIHTLWEIYKAEFSENLKQLKDGEPLTVYYPLHQNYFTIYESNGSIIGQIPDGSLRIDVVITYLKAKGLIDSHLFNNRLIDEYSRLQRLKQTTRKPKYDQQLDAAKETLSEYATSIKASYIEIGAMIEMLIIKIDRFLAAHRFEFQLGAAEQMEENYK